MSKRFEIKVNDISEDGWMNFTIPATKLRGWFYKNEGLENGKPFWSLTLFRGSSTNRSAKAELISNEITQYFDDSKEMFNFLKTSSKKEVR
jgi:hypothetical protein